MKKPIARLLLTTIGITALGCDGGVKGKPENNKPATLPFIKAKQKENGKEKAKEGKEGADPKGKGVSAGG